MKSKVKKTRLLGLAALAGFAIYHLIKQSEKKENEKLNDLFFPPKTDSFEILPEKKPVGWSITTVQGVEFINASIPRFYLVKNDPTNSANNTLYFTDGEAIQWIPSQNI